jgi:O-antigen/teichoic acid export membrane protein
VLNLAWGWRYLSFKDLRLDLKFLKPYLQFGFMFYISNGVMIIWQKVGNPIVAYLTTDSSEVALFDIPNQIFLITTSFLLVTIGYLVPIFVHLLATGKEEKLVTWSNLLLKYIFAMSTMMVGGFLIAGHELIPILIGRQYSSIYPNALVLLMGTFPMIVVQLGYVFCIIYKKARQYLFAVACALLAFVASAFVLVPPLASLGASLAMLLSTGVAAFALGVIFWRQVKPCLQEGLQVALLGGVFIPFWFLRHNLIIDLLLAIAAGILYLLILLISRKLRIEEMAQVIQAIRPRPSVQV